MRSLIVATRGSAMALAQTRMVMSELKKCAQSTSPEIELELSENIIKTCGDSWQGTNKAAAVDKRKWMGALEDALVAGQADFAVHSGKDVPSEINKSTAVMSVLKRANPQDVFIGKMLNGTRQKLVDIKSKKQILVGTASLRRQMQFKTEYPNAALVAHRGNVPTRIQNLDLDPKLDGIIIAAAGLERLGTKDLEYEYLSSEKMIPAVNQGILAVQFKKDNLELASLLKRISDTETQLAFECERHVVAALEGGCHSALGVYAIKQAHELKLRVRIVGVKSGEILDLDQNLRIDQWQTDADKIVKQLRDSGSASLLAEAEPKVEDLKHQCNGNG